MKRQPWSLHGARAADRVASLDPAELHLAIAHCAIDAVKNGIAVELIDGHTAIGTAMLGLGRNRQHERALHLQERIVDLERTMKNARRNANSSDDPEVARGFLSDAEEAQEELRRLRAESMTVQTVLDSDGLPPEFESGADFLAHALARLACCDGPGPAELSDALSRVLRFTSIDTAEPGWANLDFELLIPADGRVARLGPISVRVPNRAYRNTLTRLVPPDDARGLLIEWAVRHGVVERLQHSSVHRVLQEIMRLLAGKGYSPDAASLMVRSGLAPVYAVIGHDLWGEPVPDDLDPAYVEHVLRTYQARDFSWLRRDHSIDCTLRQMLIDEVWRAGGTINLEDLLPRLEGTRVTRNRVTVFSRPQQIGASPAWEPCVRRSGNWANKALAWKKILHVVDCPHCGSSSRHAVRTPESSYGLMCPECRRTPDADSPVYPVVYLSRTDPAPDLSSNGNRLRFLTVRG